MLTDKQIRNGATGVPVATGNTAIPGPDSTSVISAAAAAAVVAGDYGAHGTSTVKTEGMTVVDWETGVAGHDMPGEA